VNETVEEIEIDKTYDNAAKYIDFLKAYECPHCHTLIKSLKREETGNCTKCSWKGKVI